MGQDESFLGVLCSRIEDNGDLWLSESSVSELLSGESSPCSDVVKNRDQPQFPHEFPYEWNLATEANFSSPVESEAGSHETESEEDDYIADLAERIAHSMLDDDDTTDLKEKSKNWIPEETSPWAADAGKGLLYRQLSFPGSESCWSSSSAGNSNGSSQVSSQVSSPPSTPLGAENDDWDLFYAAVREVARMKTNDEMMNAAAAAASYSPLGGGGQRADAGVANQRQQGIWGESGLLMAHSTQLLPSGWGNESHIKINSFPALPSLYGDKAASSPQYFQRSLCAETKEDDRKITGTQPRFPKQTTISPPWIRQSRPSVQQQSSGCNRSYKSGNGQRASWVTDVSSSQFPPMQPAGGSGLRAVFLGSNLSGRESTGTGVFLPRPIGSGTDNKRKPACSTVLLPSRVVQALNLNVEDVRSPPLRSNATCTPPTTATRRDSASLHSTSSIPYSMGQPVGRENRANSTSLRKSIYSTCSPLQQVAHDIIHFICKNYPREVFEASPGGLHL